uniref:Uncharacterized protein n=1 Tax=Sinocyclocheilus anshuiensis TaxID=1608454 RepID=A0A671SDS4_9TELE
MPANYSYMVALGIDFATQKMARMLKPQKFEEITKGLDNRKYQTTVNWDNQTCVCAERRKEEQRMDTLDGGRHSLPCESSELRCEDQICKQTYERTACTIVLN